ncbi:tolR protein [Salmonella enterica subsp. enterica serovar Daytona]|uniref:TolR protein n=1 Tax=Salmonella enterica subsp. enterica serovar Daytona TaxID=1962639 RepID=A0A447JL02_SALET|nr:tolR protein [Salmonella enterica subsp. enterica serovar Daytona]
MDEVVANLSPKSILYRYSTYCWCLLLIFMATAPIITQSVEVDLPEANQSQAVSSNDDPPVIIEVSGVGQYSVVVDKDRMDQLPSEQVIAEVKRHLQG